MRNPLLELQPQLIVRRRLRDAWRRTRAQQARHLLFAEIRLLWWWSVRGVRVCRRGERVQGKISRDDVADLCVALLASKAAANTTFEVGSTLNPTDDWTGREISGEEWPQTGPSRDWEAELLRAGLQTGVTGKTVNGVYTGTDPEDASAAAADREVATA